MLTQQKIIKTIEQNKKQIREFGVKSIALFGSYAHKSAKKKSDIDFLVEFKRGRGLFDDYIGLYHLLEDLFKKKIDLVEKHLVREELKKEIIGGKKIEAKI